MLVSLSFTWRIVCLELALIGLGLLSTPSHALSLGDLAISSRTAPHFSASVPFSDNNPVRLSELQTRLATDAEYAQWGLQSPSEIRQLRIRVVPASNTVGYIELNSLTPLSQESFDLLLWASYARQTILIHYKVALLDVPTLIKGKTVSASRTPMATPSLGANASKAKAFAEISADPTPQVFTKEDLNSTLPAPTPMTEPVTQAQGLLSPKSEITPPTVISTGEGDRTWSEDIQHIYGPLIAFFLGVFLFGFFLGRPPQKTTHKAPEKRLAAPQSATLISTQSGASSQMSMTQTPPVIGSLITEPPLSVATSGTIVRQSPLASQPVARITLEPKACATALPTPGLRKPTNRSMHSELEKSAGKANIDLARIYLSMGDPSTAQVVLKEVIREGTEFEKTIAQQLLQQIV